MQMKNAAGTYRAKTDQEVSRSALDLGPPLPSEAPKAPWRPKVAGIIAFFFGPMAGALVVVSSLKRMGHQERAKRVMLLALAGAVIVGALLFFIPESLAGIVGFGTEIAFLLVFPVLMEREFTQWQAAHLGEKPASGWGAIGWGLAGIVLYLVILFLVFLAVSALPIGQ